MAAKNWLCAAALLALPAAAGCGGSSSSSVGAPAPAPRSVSATLSDGLTATLTEDRATVAVGGTVNYTVTLTNATVQPITFQPLLGPGTLSNAVPATLEVLDPAGNLAYPLGPAAQIVFLGQSVTIAPGQSVSATRAVDTTQETASTIAEGYNRPGQYTATAAIYPDSTASGSSQANKPLGPIGVVAQ